MGGKKIIVTNDLAKQRKTKLTMEKYKDKAITILQTLINATGAEIEDELLAIDIIADNLKKECDNAVLGHVSETPVSNAKNIIADIFGLVSNNGKGTEELNRATDAMYSYLDRIDGSR